MKTIMRKLIKNYIVICICAAIISLLFGCAFSDGVEDRSLKPDSDMTTSEEISEERDIQESDNSIKEKTAEKSSEEKSQKEKSQKEKSQKEKSKTEKSSTEESTAEKSDEKKAASGSSIADIPAYSGKAYVELNDNIPAFTDQEKKRTDAFEEYSSLDSKGRCGVAYANICKDIMPTEKRGEIGSIRPSGWHTIKYPEVIKDNYLYNRSHLIAYSLAGENANEQNLITGTRYLNQETMQIFELRVLDYVRNSGNHVLYRVTPVFEGDNLLASGVQMEGWSVEDEGKEICFNVFCYNVQPGIEIDYASGESRLAGGDDHVFVINSQIYDKDGQVENEDSQTEYQDSKSANEDSQVDEKDGQGTKEESQVNNKDSQHEGRDKKSADTVKNDSGDSTSDFEDRSMTYILNTNTKKVHLPDCRSVSDMADHNKQEYEGTLKELKSMGYSPCGRCLAQYR